LDWTYDTSVDDSIKSMTGNFTAGIDDVSEKIPTILLIAAVVLLFGVLILLIKHSTGLGINLKGGL